MGFPKLGSFRKIAWQLAEENKIKRLEFEILLWLSEQEWASQHQIWKSVPCSKPSIIRSMRRLEETGWVRIIRREYKPQGMARKYAVTPKARRMVTNFYIKIQSK
jgi:DNA-binding MarR family transcriptional regulator